MEKNLTKAKLISYLQSEDQEISQAAFGYVIRDIIHNVHPLLQMPEVIKYSRHISFARKEEILLEISSKLQGYQEISHFIQLSYWYPNQLFLISRFLETTLDANLEAKLLEIIGDKKNTSNIPSICYQALLKKALLGHAECKRMLELLLDLNPDYLMKDLIEIIQKETSLEALALLERLVQNNENDNNLMPLLQCMEKYVKIHKEDIVNQILLKFVTQYAGSPAMNRYEVDTILRLINQDCENEHVKFFTQKEILKTLIFNVKETYSLAMEDIIQAFSQFITEQKAYPFALEIIKETVSQKKYKRANILWLAEFMVSVHEDNSLFDEFVILLKEFIIKIGKNFDKSDMERLKIVLQLCQKKLYLSELLKEILKQCQETSFQIEMLLVYAENYPTHRQKIIKAINWQVCPISSVIPYKLQLFYEKDKNNGIYLDIFNKLVLRPNIDSYLMQQYGKMLSEFNLSEDTLKKYAGIAKQIKEYQERQNLLELLNS